ncbi:MAG TPA: YceI family protein [Acidimicrobiia bacterium]|nr:YceI family protein [Acidimicrobiia bacterium]
MRRAALIGIAVVAAIGLGAFAFIWFSGGSGQPSTQLTTPPLASDTTAAGAPAPISDDAVPTTPATIGSGSSPARIFVLGEGSQARFELDEELRGSPKHVVGTTPEVVGQVRFDPTDPAGAELSDIVINARTFQTDSSNRDRAIRSAVVLDSGSDEFELITFRPASVDGLAGPLAVGDTVTFTVTGELSLKGVAQPTTFDVEATWLDENTLEGTAEVVVDRTDFGIGIPSVASVANVTEEVLIALDFVAVAG